MQSTETSSNFEQTVLQRLEQIGSFEQNVLAFEQNVLQRLDKVDADLGQIKQEQALMNVRVDTYQKASNQVVNLAFGLIATATITIIASVILK
jgi:regulatory protein YycI of two-component signal transduction system YycFG